MEKYILIGESKIWTIKTGAGIPLILCNGGPGCDDYLEPVAKILEKRCEVVRFEPRGCGRSDYDGQYDLDTTINDIDQIRRAYGFEKILIAGHSAGVDFALAYTLHFPRHVEGMIGISGGRIVNDREWSAVYKQNRAEFGEDYGGKVFIADPEVNRVGNQSWRKYIRRPDLLKDIADIEIPVVFLLGEKDIRPAWPTQQLALLISKGRYREIAGAAHNIWLTHSMELEQELDLALDWIYEL